jgi:hypothetical protein
MVKESKLLELLIKNKDFKFALSLLTNKQSNFAYNNSNGHLEKATKQKARNLFTLLSMKSPNKKNKR